MINQVTADNIESSMKIADIIAMLKKANVTVSRTTFDRWIKSGYFPPCDIRIGNSRRWLLETVKAWLRKCVKDAES